MVNGCRFKYLTVKKGQALREANMVCNYARHYVNCASVNNLPIVTVKLIKEMEKPQDGTDAFDAVADEREKAGMRAAFANANAKGELTGL